MPHLSTPSIASTFRDGLRKVGKLGRLTRRPVYVSALRHGVAAAVEHDRIPFAHDFATVIDVGAGRGQFALVARRRFASASLHCFEPLPEARDKLVALVGSRRDVRIYGFALGSTGTSAQLHISAKGDSSSLLPITPRQVEAFPGTGERDRMVVRQARLDEVMEADRLAAPTLLKIDVQGYELEVLRGAEHVLHLMDEILVECSFAELYADQPLVDGVVCHLHSKGFVPAGVFSVVHDRAGRCLQADFLFQRSSTRATG